MFFTDRNVRLIDPPAKPARDGAGRDQHLHIWLDALAGGKGEAEPAGGLPKIRAGQTTEPESAGFDQGEPCILQRSNDDPRLWVGRDQRTGQIYAVRGTDDGNLTLSIHHEGEGTAGEEAADQVDPTVTGAHPATISGEHTVGAAHDADNQALRRFQRDGRARHVSDEYAANRARARLIADYYAARR
jgi:hypothetical protein